MKKLLPIIVIAIAGYVAYVQQHPRLSEMDTADSGFRASEVATANTSPRPSEVPAADSTQSGSALASAFANHLSNIRVQGQGQVTKVLPDDNDGSRHQRFIVHLSSGQKILIAHNIDLAPRVSSLSAGDAVEFKGEYAWNARGGVVHWTHRDPAGHHAAGWLRHNGQTVQ